MKEIIQIKNMVCARCIMAVENILKDLEIDYLEVQLGEVILPKALAGNLMEDLQTQLKNVGFEIIESREQRLINRIKSLLIQEVYASTSNSLKLSSFLTGNLNYDYSHLTQVFKEAEGLSLQKYYNAIRIERVKELLEYDEYDISAIADELGYSTAAYLSTSFKKATGHTPSQYRNMSEKNRRSLDSV